MFQNFLGHFHSSNNPTLIQRFSLSTRRPTILQLWLNSDKLSALPTINWTTALLLHKSSPRLNKCLRLCFTRSSFSIKCRNFSSSSSPTQLQAKCIPANSNNSLRLRWQTIVLQSSTWSSHLIAILNLILNWWESLKRNSSVLSERLHHSATESYTISD